MQLRKRSIVVLLICFFASTKLMAQDQAVLYPLDSAFLYAGPLHSRYIINPAYVVYQWHNMRKIVYADMHTFKKFDSSVYSQFAIDKNGVYFEGALTTPDTVGFKVIGTNFETTHVYWKTNYKVFDNNAEITGADAPTFTLLGVFNEGFFVDKNTVYHFNKKLPDSDGSTAHINGDLIYDNRHVYRDDSVLTYQGKRLYPVNFDIAKTDDEVIAVRGMKAIKNMDVNSLTTLSFGYSKDKYGIYYQTTLLKDANPNSDQIKVWDSLLSDGNHLYYQSFEFLDGIDVATFQPLAIVGMFYDKNGIYYQGWNDSLMRPVAVKIQFDYDGPFNEKNVSLSANTQFIILGKQVYELNNNKRIVGLTDDELARLKVFKGRYLSKNFPLSDQLNGKVTHLGDFTIYNNHVFYGDNKIKNVNATLLSGIGGGYYRYKNKVYVFYRADSLHLVNYAHTASFKVDGNTVLDKNYVYSGTVRLFKNNHSELLAIFTGPRYGGDEGWWESDYYLYHTDEGYWLWISNNGGKSAIAKAEYLGKSIDPKIIRLPDNFEFAKSPARK